MIKKTVVLILSLGLGLFFLIGCGEQPQPKAKPQDHSSYKKDSAMWQNYQADKALKGLDNE